jgi:hypothetical protein
VTSRVGGLWQAYAFPVDQQDNALAVLTLLHTPVRCIIKPEEGDDDDVFFEVSADTHVSRRLRLRWVPTPFECVLGSLVGDRGDVRLFVCVPQLCVEF